MKIQKSKFIRVRLAIVFSFAIIFSVLLCYFLGWDFKIKTFGIAILIIFILLVVLWVLCFLLIKFEQKYYVIDNKHLTIWQNNEVLCELLKDEIIEICYIRFFWLLMFQMGGGYLNVTCNMESLPNRKFASIIMPNGIAILTISMSKKQAKDFAKIINRELIIK